jgi:flagellar hook assembly protein FlgD
MENNKYFPNALDPDYKAIQIKFDLEPQGPEKVTTPVLESVKINYVTKATARGPLGKVLVKAGPIPFNPNKDGGIQFKYDLPKDSDVEFYIFSQSGELIKKVKLVIPEIGTHFGLNTLTWDGKDMSGKIVGKGTYILQFKIDNELQSIPFIVTF